MRQAIIKFRVSLNSDEHKTPSRLVVKLTGSAAQWKQFAIVDMNGVSVVIYVKKTSLFFQSVLSSVNLDKKPPQPFCCFEREEDMGLFGEYGIISDPIEVIDSRTLKVPKFSYKASETPGSMVVR